MQVNLHPVQSSFLFASMPIGIAVGILVAQRTSQVLGRVPTMLLCKWLAALLLTLMALDKRLWAVKWAIVPIYLVRTSMANCTRALASSILMDYVPKVHDLSNPLTLASASPVALALCAALCTS